MLLVSTLFCSCKLFGEDSGEGSGNSDGSGNNGNSDSSQDSPASDFFREGKQFYFVQGEDASVRDEVDGIYSYVAGTTKVSPKLIGATETGGDNEIVVGKCDRDISVKAYRLLARHYDGTDNETVWLIYVQDNSVCIAFDSSLAMSSAIDYFEDNLLNENFGEKSGVVAYEHSDKLSLAHEEREAEHAAALAGLEPKLGVEAVSALNDLYGLYDEGLYMWLANLWCPDVGGFYYSNSGRDTEGFLPDIESTKQVLGFIVNSGMIAHYNGAGYGEALLQDYPEIAEKILNFAVGLQAEDGYFYHPQWKDAPSTSRLGRDLSSAKGIISKLGGTAKYPYPGEGVATEASAGIAPASKLTGSFRNTGATVLSVSRIVATAAPAYLRSLDKWAAYIDSLEIDKGNSYSGGNTLVSQTSAIKAAGQKYCDYLINYLNSKQRDNGTWELEISYGAIDGLMKISGIYEDFGVQLPRAKIAAQSCIKRIIDNTPKSSSEIHVCDVYNPWYALAAIIRMTRSDSALNGEINQCVKDSFAEMVESARQKMSIFQKTDGSFSWYEKESHYTSQGSVVAVPKTNEGDVNASTIASGELLTWVFNCIGVKSVPLYYEYDFEIFMSTICNLGSIIKNEAPEPVAITFDDVDVSSMQTTNGIVKSPDSMIEVAVRDKEIEYGKYKWVDSKVVTSPNPREDNDNAIRFEVITMPCTCAGDPCTCKKVATTASVLYSKTQNGTMLGNAYVAEFDFYLDEWGSNNIITQIGFSESEVGGYSMMFNLRTYTASDGKNYIRLEDYYAGLDGVTNTCLVEGIPAKEWARFRFELYKTEQLYTDKKSGEVKQLLANVCKLYVNGEYVSESDAAIIKDDGTTSNKHVNAFSIQGYRHVPSVFYVDNVLVYRTNTEFVSEEKSGNSVLDNIAVDKTKTVADFEDGKTVTYYLKNTILPDYIKYTVEKIAGKKALHVEKFGVHSSAQSDTQASLSNPTDDGECYTYETKIYYDSTKIEKGKHVSQLSVNAASSLSFISLNFKFNGSKIEVLHNKNCLNGSDVKSTGAVVGIDGKALTLPVDEWFTFKLEFYRAETPSESMVKIYTGDANGENMALCAEFNGYMTEKIREIERFLFTHYRATKNISVYLDDISFTRSNKEFVSELPEEPVTPPVTPPAVPDTPTEHSPIESFDDLTTLKGDGSDSDVKFGIGTFTTSDGSVVEGDEIKIVKDPTGEDNNVLMFKDGSTSSYSSIWISVNSKNGKAKNGISVFETKLYVPKSEILSAGVLAQPQYGASSGGRLCYENLVISDDKSYMYFELDNTEGAETEGNITTDAWHTLRLEFYNYASGAGTPIIKIYVDNLYAGYTDVTTVKDTTGFRWAGVASAKYTVYFDDMSLTEKAMPTE